MNQVVNTKRTAYIQVAHTDMPQPVVYINRPQSESDSHVYTPTPAALRRLLRLLRPYVTSEGETWVEGYVPLGQSS